MRLDCILALPAVALLGSGLTLAAAPSALAEGTGLDVAAFSCPQPNGLFPFPGDVTKYVQCSNNVPTVYKCPDGLNWNRNGQYCDWPASAGAVADRYPPGKFR
ncbi:carbohydrate-binding module family 14 protein [Nocardia sp. NBC_01730]|uniref:carbohydrate-binding module family 14 protein n=1 Tax=Nocardia sp. NBC_01730 TaxID=2975998 RepID=UPI002E15EC1D|nr:carbohydrate-binding module family 14 protein [Nocardia sp. NBC_01730]